MLGPWIKVKWTVEAETPTFWPPDVKTWLIWKDPDVEKDWRQEEKGMTKDEMFRWHHWLNGYEFEWARGVGDGQRGLACCGSWGHKESDTSEWLNWLTHWDMVKQEMPRVNLDIIGISELKWTGIGEFSSDDHYIYYCGQESLRRMMWNSLSRVRLFASPWTIQSMEFSRPKWWGE